MYYAHDKKTQILLVDMTSNLHCGMSNTEVVAVILLNHL